MSSRLRRLAAAALTGALTGALAVTSSSAPAAAAVIQCPASADVFVWDGNAGDTAGKVGDNRSWNDAYNWNQDCVPGLRNQTSGDGYDDVVTIPSGASVRLNDEQSAQILTLTNRGTLTVTPAAKLITYGPSTSNILTLQGLLAGEGRFTVTNRLNWVATASSGSTQATRECTSQCSAALPAGAEGTTVIASGASMRITGRGVNLQDQRVIENHGLVLLTNSGYIAADDGTRFRNVRSSTADVVPRFIMRNDGGYYQGFSRLGLPRSIFSNGGRVIKDGGVALSIVDSAFSATDPASVFAGKVEVKAGSLSILGQSDEVRTAQVRQGRSFGNGGCVEDGDPASCATLRPTSADPQMTTVELTQPGTSLRTVTLRELPTLVGPDTRGVPVQIDTPSASASTTEPLRFRVLLDATLVAPGETAVQVAQTSPVYRQATTAQPYVALPDCGATGNPTLAQPSCVSRARSVSETTALGSGDVVVVISSLQNSRYRIGR